MAARVERLACWHSAIDSGERKPLELTRLDDALTDLEALDPRQAEIVTLKFFGGLDGEEIAAALSISTRTVKREWAMAKLWLGRAMAS